MRDTLLYDFMHCMTAVSLEMSDEPEYSLYREQQNYTILRSPPLLNILQFVRH